MRLIYHSLGNVDEGYGRDRDTGYSDSLRTYLEEVSRPDTEIELRGTRGGIADQYRFFASQDTRDVMQSMVYARHNDIDGVAVGNVVDPAVQEGREILDVPVTGFTETTALLATMMGEQVATIPIHPKHEAISRELLRKYGLSERVFVRPMEVDLDQMASGFSDETIRNDIVSEFESTVATCVDEGAEVVIPGAGILSMFLNDEGIRELHGAPVVDGIAVLVRMTETLVDLYEMGAASTSKLSMYQGPPDEFMDELEKMYELTEK